MSGAMGIKGYVSSRYAERRQPPQSSYAQQQPLPTSRHYYDYHADPYTTRERESNQGVERRQLPRSYAPPPQPLSPRGPTPAVSHALPSNYRFAEYRQTALAQPARSTASSSNVSHAMHSHDYRASADYHSHPKYSHTQAASSMPSAITTAASTQPVERFAHPLQRREQTMPKAPPAPMEPPATNSSAKRPSLECTVCGPDAMGPWRRGPIGPYTLCDTCARIDWKEDGASVPANVHEALSLLDNMRLIRLASVIRKGGDRTQMELARRLQNGLPDSTYAKTEEYFARQAKAEVAALPQTAAPATTVAATDRQTEPQVSSADTMQREARAQTVAPIVESMADARVGQKRRSSFEDSVVGSHATMNGNPYTIDEHRDKRPAAMSMSTSMPASKSDDRTSNLSPQSLAIAALMIQRADSTKDVPRTPLTPVRGEVIGMSNRKGSDALPKKEAAAIVSIDSSMPNLLPTPKLTDPLSSSKSDVKSSPPAVSEAIAQLVVKAFPFRDADHFNQSPQPRIIDRRRARNEALRQKYLQRRVEQQRAREAKAAESEATKEKESSTVNAASTLSPRAVDTPASEASAKFSHGTPDIVEPPASLRDLVDGFKESA